MHRHDVAVGRQHRQPGFGQPPLQCLGAFEQRRPPRRIAGMGIVPQARDALGLYRTRKVARHGDP